MIRRYPLGLVMVAIVAGMVVCGVAQAGTVPLSELLQPGATFTSGDKIFSDFTYEKTGDNPVCRKCERDRHSGCDRATTVSSIQGGFLDLSGGDASDALITFTVSVPAGSNLVDLRRAPVRQSCRICGTGLASVTETFLPDIHERQTGRLRSWRWRRQACLIRLSSLRPTRHSPCRRTSFCTPRATIRARSRCRSSIRRSRRCRSHPRWR